VQLTTLGLHAEDEARHIDPLHFLGLILFALDPVEVEHVEADREVGVRWWWWPHVR
jgi:hypothetical protein